MGFGLQSEKKVILIQLLKRSSQHPGRSWRFSSGQFTAPDVWQIFTGYIDAGQSCFEMRSSFNLHHFMPAPKTRPCPRVIPAQYSRCRIYCDRWIFLNLCRAIHVEDRASIFLPRQPVQIHYLYGTSDKWGICFPVLSAALKYAAGYRWVRLQPSHRKAWHSRNSIPCRQRRLLRDAQSRYSDRPR